MGSAVRQPTPPNACLAASDLALLRCATWIARSPTGRDRCFCSAKSLLKLLRAECKPQKWLDPTRVSRLGDAIGELSGELLRIRVESAWVGGRQYPPAAAFSELFRAAATDVRALPHVEACGVAGLYFLIIHPFGDGNGRAARTIWVHGLLHLGRDPDECISVVDQMIGPLGVAILPALEVARTGDLRRFLRGWNDAVNGSSNVRTSTRLP
jgi:hypothetical protein